MTRPEILAADKAFAALVCEGRSARQIEREYVRDVVDYDGYGEATIRRAAAIVKGQPHGETDGHPTREETTKTSVTTNADGTTTVIAPPSYRVMSADDLFRLMDVRPDDWEVITLTVNKWESANGEGDITQLFQVKAVLRPVKDARKIEAIRDELLDIVRQGAPTFTTTTKAKSTRTVTTDRYLYEVSIFDAHLGKYAWSGETGEDYDTDIAVKRFRAAADHLADRVKGLPIERVVLPLGNDFFQSDNERSETTRGTYVDTDTRYQKSFRAGCDVAIETVMRYAEIAPVDVVIVPGNHDQLGAFHLGMFLEAYFSRHDGVTIDNGASLRKYYRYGTSLIGFTHGNNEKPQDLPLIMAQERPQDWAVTTSREFHCGHYHKRKEARFIAGDTYGGVVVRTLPSLSGTDRWHHDMGYVGGMKAAEAYLHEFAMGYAGHFSYNHTGD